MERQSLDVLEYPLIDERLAAATSTEQGADLARELVPSSDPDEVARRQARTAEAVGLLAAGAPPALHGATDVRAAAARAGRGIVHDASSSGQTLFVEPLAVVELNNRLAESASAEREEVERILAEVSTRVGVAADALAVLVGATAALDLALACGTLSRRWRGTP